MMKQSMPVVLCIVALSGAPGAAAQEYQPEIAAASTEGEDAIQRFRIPEPFRVELFAAEPLLANPVAFCIDERGRFYVAETFRLYQGVTDNRRHMYWLQDDLACRTVEDRLAMYKKHLKDRVQDYGVAPDRVRLIEDRDGDGRADHATVFADGFNQIVDGIGAGLLARQGNVWFTCIPSLWLLRDEDADGKAEVREPLYSGFGVHVSFLGHDLHGLKLGPDGRLYFSIGDRGFNVPTPNGGLEYPDTGAVLRCDPDGSNLEVFAFGMRNPQELAFDDYGNLFTGDNNSDSGDRSRWVYLVEGGDSGWRIGYQYHRVPRSRGPWNAERLWYPAFEGQAAYIVPPIANISDGPSGLAYYPGTGLPEQYDGHFFLCDFRGDASRSGVRSFAMKPKGASFELVDSKQFLWSILATDVDFGPDGALYVCDWVQGWDMPKKGRLYKITDPDRYGSSETERVRRLIAEGFSQRTTDELLGLLRHRDQRVRLEAQFALAQRPQQSTAGLVKVAQGSDHPLARLHAIWALGQIHRGGVNVMEQVAGLLEDQDAEVRAQMAKTLGDCGIVSSGQALAARLRDASPRVQFFAAMALGKLQHKRAVPAVLDMLRANQDKDPYLRHAGVMALTWMGDVDAVLAAANDHSPAVRMAVLLTLRRLRHPDVARFLADTDPLLVQEAARAINDVPILEGMPELAKLAGRESQDDMLYLRAMNANFRLGGRENARAIAQVAGNSERSNAVRIEALRQLEAWGDPPGLDRVMGLWRPLEPRPADAAADALRRELPGILTAPSRVRRTGVQVAGKLGIRDTTPLIVKLLHDTTADGQERSEALAALQSLEDPELQANVEFALRDENDLVRAEARRILVSLAPERALGELQTALRSGTIAEQKAALGALASLKIQGVDELLSGLLDRMIAGSIAPEIQLELCEAAAQRDSEVLKSQLTNYNATRAAQGKLAEFSEALYGGDAERGEAIFYYNTAASCVRCHKVRGTGGEVGPELDKIASKNPREYLLEAIVDPNKKIAEGFETLVIATTEGRVLTGIVKADTPDRLELVTAEGAPFVVLKQDIEAQRRGDSAMPADVVKQLSRSELRDLVAFLATLKE